MDVWMMDQIWESDMNTFLDIEKTTDTDIDALNDHLLNSVNESSFNDLFQWREACLEQFGDILQVPQLEDEGQYLIY